MRRTICMVVAVMALVMAGAQPATPTNEQRIVSDALEQLGFENLGDHPNGLDMDITEDTIKHLQGLLNKGHDVYIGTDGKVTISKGGKGSI